MRLIIKTAVCGTIVRFFNVRLVLVLSSSLNLNVNINYLIKNFTIVAKLFFLLNAAIILFVFKSVAEL